MLEDSLTPRTQFDLNFRIGDISVRVHPFFWLTTVLLGLPRDTRQAPLVIMTELLAWIGIVFVSILVHELGHVLMGRRFGSRGHIILTAFCGLAVGSSELPTRGQRIAVYLAGPGAGFLLAGLVVAVTSIIYPNVPIAMLSLMLHVDLPRGEIAEVPPAIVFFIMYNMLWINIFWGLINLLPIWPLDGGQVCKEICETYRGREGHRLSLQIGVFTAAAFAVLALIEMVTKTPVIPFLSMGGDLFPVLFFGLLGVNCWQVLKFVQRSGGGRWQDEDHEPRAPWERDPDWWKKGDNSWRD